MKTVSEIQNIVAMISSGIEEEIGRIAYQIKHDKWSPTLTNKQQDALKGLLFAARTADEAFAAAKETVMYTYRVYQVDPTDGILCHTYSIDIPAQTSIVTMAINDLFGEAQSNTVYFQPETARTLTENDIVIRSDSKKGWKYDPRDPLGGELTLHQIKTVEAFTATNVQFV